MACSRGVAWCIFPSVVLCMEIVGHVELPAHFEQAVRSLRNGRQLPPYGAGAVSCWSHQRRGPWWVEGRSAPTSPCSLDSWRLLWDIHAPAALSFHTASSAHLLLFSTGPVPKLSLYCAHLLVTAQCTAKSHCLSAALGAELRRHHPMPLSPTCLCKEC